MFCRQNLIAWLATTAWLIYLTPSPMYFALDADGGFFITGGWLQRETGRLMQIDVLSSYGPLSFELRSWAQQLVGDRPLAEVLVAVFGFGLAHTVFFVAVSCISGSIPMAATLLGVALLCLPRYYKFFVVLVPAITCLAAWHYSGRPGRRSAIALGAAVGLAFAFRHDYGVYAAAVALTALALAPGSSRARLQAMALAAAGALTVLAPWLVQLVAQGAIWRHLEDLVTVSRSYNGGLGLPHPLLAPTWHARTLVFALFYVVPAAATWVSWRRCSVLSPTERAQAAVVVVTGTVFLGQSLHRADVGHLLQCSSAVLLTLALLWRLLEQPGARRGLVVLMVALATGGLTSLAHSLRGPTAVGEAWRGAMLDRDSWRQQVAVQSPELGTVLRLLDCLPKQRTVALYPFAPQLAYLAERRFAGDTLLIAPGYFESLTHQERMVDGLRRDVPVAVLWDENFAYDNDPRRNTVRTHALLHAYVSANLQLVGTVGRYSLYVDPSIVYEHVSTCWQL